MRAGLKVGGWSAGLAALLVASVLVSAGIGSVSIPALTVAQVCLNALVLPTSLSLHGGGHTVAGVALPALSVSTTHVFHFQTPETSRIIVTTIRLPRIVLAALVGFALALAGTVMQGFFRNPMADPSIIGVSSGAAVGAVTVITVGVSLPFGLGLHGAAFLGGLLAAFGIYALGSRAGHTPVTTLLLAGVAVETFLGAVISFMLVESGNELRTAMYWLMGHLQNAGWGDVAATALTLPLLFGVLLGYRRHLNVLLLGEQDAQTLGIEVERTKRILLAVSALVTAIAVSVSGVIGFVGLVVPHVMRLLVGPDHRILLPTSALAGASFLVAADTVARSGPAQLPVGIVTAFVGAPFFLYLLRRREVSQL
ncbi:vitamin B12 ABC transporter permease BtuC [Halocalculus aciditolerans]|uniref:Cobalamin import system permease BtuC n=1 Tax=Halocalculus aciditolerans TaxID=1383812 RepID=A0A830F5P3_9EURY|nr:vitamin B12 ABC transporter permease BtuC [Halocalculus aciditolerans]GGL65660.1 cobalamin import system permease BtuC [Halocalculus aciditolerans]